LLDYESPSRIIEKTVDRRGNTLMPYLSTLCLLEAD
jgi:hypothetical protein